jgi:tetratricopeptide (TPR) repeat protein
VRRGLAQERPAGPTWGLELTDREAGGVAWELIDEQRRRVVADKFAAMVQEEHGDHPVSPDERPALAARAYLRAGMPETALPLLAAATRHEQAAGRAASGLAMADLWVDTAREVGSNDVTESLETRVTLASSACDWARAEEDLDAMQELAGEDAERTLRVLTARAQLFEQSQNHDGCVETVERAFSVALQTDAQPEALFRLSHLLASVTFRSGSLVASRDRWLAVAADARRSGNPYWEMTGRLGAATADLQLGEFEPAELGFAKAMQLADDQCDQLTGLLAGLEMAALGGLRGDPERARSDALAVADRASDLGLVRVLGLAVTCLGELCRRLDLLDEADQHLDRGARILRATDQRVTLALCLGERALVALARGDLDSAQNHAAGASMAAALNPGVLLEQERIHAAVGRVAESRGDRAALAAARRSAVSCLEQQAGHLGAENLGRWVAVASRLEVVTWTGWSPRSGRR